MEQQIETYFAKELAQQIQQEQPHLKVIAMHNNEERKAFATQTEDLTGLRYGAFEHQDGYLVNEEHNIAVLLPEKNLQELAAFNQVKEQFNLSSAKVDFVVKQQMEDINYIVRENNGLGVIVGKKQTYQAFEERPSAHGDATKIILLEIDGLGEKQTLDLDSYECKKRVCDDMAKKWCDINEDFLHTPIETTEVKSHMIVEDNTHDIAIPVWIYAYETENGFKGDLTLELENLDEIREELAAKLDIDYDDDRIDKYLKSAIVVAEQELTTRAKADYYEARIEDKLEDINVAIVGATLNGNDVKAKFKTDKGETFTVSFDQYKLNGATTDNPSVLKSVVADLKPSDRKAKSLEVKETLINSASH
nr:hypothetical protein [Moritella viscosa]SHO15779.1 Thermoregulated motility protein [Moritella viscosa]